jgi:hypothetical protein
MPSQFPISSPYPFEKDKGVGFGSFYYGHTHVHVYMIFSWYKMVVFGVREIETKKRLVATIMVNPT